MYHFLQYKNIQYLGRTSLLGQKKYRKKAKQKKGQGKNEIDTLGQGVRKNVRL